MEWQEAQSAQRPEETDTTSSKIYNYVRRNITETHTELEDGSVVTLYTYEEAKIPKASWALYQMVVAQRAEIDYLTMITE